MRPLCLSLLLLFALPAFAQDREEIDPSTLTEEEKREIARQVQALQGPGPEHELLARSVGRFDTLVELWPTPGAAESMTFRGSSEGKLLLDGSFLQLESTTGGDGFTVGSMGLLGFDRRFGHYTYSGYDTTATYGVHATGTYDEETGTLTLSGEDYDPIMKVTQKYDFVFRYPDEDTTVIEIWFKDKSHGNDEPFKMVEITHVRAED